MRIALRRPTTNLSPYIQKARTREGKSVGVPQAENVRGEK